MYREISSSTGSRQELLAAKMHLKNIIKQARRLRTPFHIYIYIYVNLIVTMVDGEFEPRMSPLETLKGAN